MELGELKVFKSEICSIIGKALRTRGASPNEIQYLYHCLPQEYKTNYEYSTTLSSDNKRLVEESRAITLNLESHFKAIEDILSHEKEHLTREAHADSVYKLNDLVDIAEDNCAARHINTLGTDEGENTLWEGLKSQFDERLQVEPSSEPKETVLSDDIQYMINKLASWRLKTIRFPPSQEQAQKWHKGIMAFCALFDPSLDEKHRRSWRQWHDIIMNRIEYSLHGSMSMSKVETKVKDVLRQITREQIDAKMLVGLKFFGDLTHIPLLVEMFEHYEKYECPDVNDLSVRMHGKLSHKS
jgi:hypothetical protein